MPDSPDLPARDARRPGYSEGRDALLDATVRVVAKRGLRGLTYRAVAEEAGTTHGLVTYHFGSRDSLILEAAAKAGQAAIGTSSLNIASGRVEDFVGTLPELAEEDADGQAFQYELAVEARRRPDLLPEVRLAYERYFAETRRALEALGFERVTDDAARLVFAAIDGLVLQQLIFGDPRLTRDAVDVLHHVLKELLGARGASA